MTTTIKDDTLGEIVLTKRRVSKTIRISVTPSGVRVSLPWYYTYSQAMIFVKKSKEKILAIRSNLEKREIVEKSDIDIELLRAQAKATLPQRVAQLAKEHNFTYNKVFIKNNRSNWGSCSSKKNINLNLQLVQLPQELIDYVILHELCHLVYMNHSPEFHHLLGTLCNGKEKELRTQLRKYRLN